MADIRENLIDILRKTRYEYRRYIAMKDYEKRIAKTEEEFCAVDDSIAGEIPFCADHLIAHGVTVQKWISVEDRLPEDWCPVLVAMDDVAQPRVGCYEKIHAMWWRDSGGVPIRRTVTHWMPMPNPPATEGTK